MRGLQITHWPVRRSADYPWPEAKDVLAYPLKILFDTPLRLNKLPDDWRAANIVPVFKKGDRKEPLNYR